MSFFSTMNISASGLTAERVRQDVISQNIANIDTTKTADGTPYKRKIALFQERGTTDGSFTGILNSIMNGGSSSGGGGVRVSRIVDDNTPGTRVYDPGNPEADADGYITKPNVNIVTEMVNMIASTRAYEANVTAMNDTKTMIAKTLEISNS